MARGFLAGAIWGAALSGAGLATISLNTPLPERAAMMPPAGGDVDSSALDPVVPADPDPAVTPADAPPAPDPSAPVAVEDPDAADPVADPGPDRSEPGRRPDPEAGVDRPRPPGGAPAVPTGPVAVGADTAPLAPPQVSGAPDAPAVDAPDPGEATVTVGRDAPVKPGARASAPGAPRPEGQPVIVTGPAQPPAPGVPDADSALIPESAEPADDAEPAAADPDAETPVAVAPSEEPVSPDPEVPDPEPRPAPVVPAAGPSAELPVPDPEAEPDPELAAPAGPAIGRPATSLVDRSPTTPPDDPEPEAEAPTTLPTALAALPEDSPLVRFSADVTVPPAVPRMAVVLIDDGRGPLGPEALASFPFPVSFAISPAHPDAAAAAKAYRELGFAEVLVLGDMPEGAQAADVEVAMAGLLRAVPEAVAMLEDPEGGLQESREVASQVAAYLGDSGHGLIMQPNGLNTAQKLALKDGVPSVTLFRDFDGEGQDATTIRRTLDQAAFRARQEAGVVMVGRLRADTVSALVLWGLQDRSDTLAMVPVSVVLAESLLTVE